MTRPFRPRRCAVLGAGVMGAQIAAHLANAGMPVLLLELAGEGDDPDAAASAAAARLTKLRPPPLATPEALALVEPLSYDNGLSALANCDLVIEAIAERTDLKRELYERIVPHLGPDAVLASNTSGLSLSVLQETLPEDVRPRFCGIHFFNPPRYMHLVELVPAAATDDDLLDRLETFLVTRIGKGVVRAKDVPNFVANRVGVFSMLSTFHHAADLGIAPDVVDALTGPAIGRPKSATYRTADVVGLDTLGHVVDASARALEDDPWHRLYALPQWIAGLIERGAVGQKAGAGVYRKTKGGIEVLDTETGAYRPNAPVIADQVQGLLAERDALARMAALRGCDHPEAQLLWRIHRDVWHYAAVHLQDIAHTARDVDLAIRWGFGWGRGPFEQWQDTGWGRVAAWISEDITAGRALADTPLPPWVMEQDAVHVAAGSWDAANGGVVARSKLPVYKRQHFPDRVTGEATEEHGESWFENDAVRLWTLDGEIGILSVQTKMGTLGTAALDGIVEALGVACDRASALVLWRRDAPFCAGADLSEIGSVLASGSLDKVDALIRQFQQMTMQLRHAPIPVVGAPHGVALGGGCEVLMHCDRLVAGFETYAGLVEIGVGLLPAGAGLKETARRAALTADPLKTLMERFGFIAKAAASASADDARRLGYLRDADVVVMNVHEVLHAALATARGMAETGYRPPLPGQVIVAGSTGLANLKGMIANLHAGGFASDHDALCATRIAEVMCGGDVDPGTAVDEQWLLDRERHAFVELCGTEKTRDRIAHMMTAGKPLRN
ncbi:MAG: 3-hydroxyacyl-CoA dehydrogenase/enoyl-CoA hydratase family protein [Planctomycetes bacterium]|nr:3-hydroxyacyl-CoA dehydrogenase/enoyl-CoA hydratase family protein [Planctomycetota bacterium]